MDLRNHPSVCFHRTRSWPPAWTHMSEGKHHKKKAYGEAGILAKAYMTSESGTVCVVIMEYQSENFVGTIVVEDHLFCKQVCLFLNKNIGKPIATIGGLMM